MLRVLVGLAEFERNIVLARTDEGWAWTKAESRKMGCPYRLMPYQPREMRPRRDANESQSAIARRYNVHHAIILRLYTG